MRTQEVDGDLVVVKEARTEDDVARLRREATMLTRGRHPGVVELVAVEDRTIRLRHAGTPLSRLGPLPLDQAAGLVSAVADVVDALHRQGVVHGGLDADHIVVDPRGRPRLCGFGRATEHEPEGATDDVAALGRLLAVLVRDGQGRPWANPPSGLGSRRRRRRSAHDLARLADRTASAEPHRRPSARQLAKAIHAAVPDQSLPTVVGGAVAPAPDPGEFPADSDPTADLGWTADELAFLARALEEPEADPFPDSEDRPAPPAREAAVPRSTAVRHVPVRALALAVLLVIGALVGVAGARALDPFGGDHPTSAAKRTDHGVGPPASPTSTAAPVSNAPAWPDRCIPLDSPGPDVDADGCPDPIRLEGRRATVGSRTVTLGNEDDLVALGDWDCDGVATPALLRPGTGEVFVFPNWSFDEPLEVVATTVVPHATDLSTGGGACPTLLATTPGGPITVELVR